LAKVAFKEVLVEGPVRKSREGRAYYLLITITKIIQISSREFNSFGQAGNSEIIWQTHLSVNLMVLISLYSMNNRS